MARWTALTEYTTASIIPFISDVILRPNLVIRNRVDLFLIIPNDRLLLSFSQTFFYNLLVWRMRNVLGGTGIYLLTWPHSARHAGQVQGIAGSTETPSVKKPAK